MSLKPVELFHAGPPKTATTWVYHVLKEHPQISTSASDTMHYFDMHFTKGSAWYDRQFTSRVPSDNIKRFDPTYSYICSPRAPERIAAYNPDAKVMVALRDPVERAFSHYWHIKKQSRDGNLQFEDALKHYNTFSTWVEHGFVGIGLKKFYDLLPRENILILLFDDLNNDPAGEYDKIAAFCGIDKTFRPSALHKKVNVAGAKKTFWQQNINRAARRMLGEKNLEELSQKSAFIRALSGKGEYVQGMSDEMRARLREICEPEIQDIERLARIDLSHWRSAQKRKEAA